MICHLSTLAVLLDHAPAAPLFDSERRLPRPLMNNILALAESIITFPTTHISSLNLGQAVTATCAALRMGVDPSIPNEVLETPVSIQKREELTGHILESLEASGYLVGRSRRLVANTLMRLSAKANLTDGETNNLLGMAKQISWWFRKRD